MTCGVIRVVTREFWNVATLGRFRAAVAASKHQLAKAGRTPLLLIDTRQQGVQGQEVVQGLRDFASSAEGSSTKTAVVVGSALYRLQTSRIRSAAHHRVFEGERDAADWLVEGSEATTLS